MRDKLYLTICFLASVVWGIYERSQEIPVSDQVFLSILFAGFLIYRIFWSKND